MIISDNGYVIYFQRGQFDSHCVHVMIPKRKKVWRPLDKNYLSWLRKQGKRRGNDVVYKDVEQLYDKITADISEEEIILITREINKNYGKVNHHWWIILALTMISEERKENSILGKRIKLLAFYNLLCDEYKISYIVTYMIGKPWWELDELMCERGI